MKTLFTCIVTFLCLSSFAQQIPTYTLFWNGYSVRNPAATGLFYKHNFSATGRLQWVGFDGAPKTANALYDLKWDKIHGGIGLNYERDQIGFMSSNRFNINYAYHISFSETKKLSIGASLTLINFAIQTPLWIAPQTPIYNSPSSTTTSNSFDMNAGLLYKTEKLHIGLCVNQFLIPKIKYQTSDSTYTYYQNARHYFAHASYIVNLSENFELIPSVFIMADYISISTNINLRAVYKKQFWIGSSYRTSDAISFMAGVDLKQKYRICYAYDFVFGPFSDYTDGSHEIGIALMID